MRNNLDATHTQHTPICRHYGECGGCSLQHLPAIEYLKIKSQILEKVIKSLGLTNEVLQPIIQIDANSRRRVEFKVQVNKGNVNIGFFASKTHNVVAISECPISEDKIVYILPSLKKCLESLKKPSAIKAISVTALDSGLDVIIVSKTAIKKADKDKLIILAKENNIIRLSEQIDSSSPSSIYDSGNASTIFGKIKVELPVGAFLQATKQGENSITNFVKENLDGCKNIADLYSGCGTYSFPLSDKAKRISSFEGAEELSLAMHNAIVQSNLDHKMTSITRDLFKRPLKPEELNQFDGVVINPPRSGAMPQIKNIANSSIGKLVMVYCNPNTFKRDLSHLLDAGYVLKKTIAIDQFVWSNHLEVVSYLEKI